MVKNLVPHNYGTNAERAAALLIHYFKVAIGEDVFRRNGGDLEAEITDIVECIINAAVEEVRREAKAEEAG